MALYRPNYKLEKAKELIDNLDDSEESSLIKYYIQEKEKCIKEQRKRLNEYRDFFEILNRFLPNSSNITRN